LPLGCYLGKLTIEVLERGLDAGTAFEILSIDIADVDVGENIGAKLQIDQANADLKVAKAKAEERRAMAVASEQEMKAKSQEARAKVILAEVEVPKAMAEAFRVGNFGVNLKFSGLGKMKEKDIPFWGGFICNNCRIQKSSR